MAIGVGFFVGMSVRFFGRGIDKSFAVTGAVLALLGCILGNLFTIVGFIAKEQSLSVFDVIFQIRPGYVFETFPSAIGPMDFLFYALALYEGYKFATIPIDLTFEGIHQQLKTARSPFVRSRTKVVMIGYLLIVFAVIGSRFLAKGEVRDFYESGALRSKGYLKNGTMHGQRTFYNEKGTVEREQ